MSAPPSSAVTSAFSAILAHANSKFLSHINFFRARFCYLSVTIGGRFDSVTIRLGSCGLAGGRRWFVRQAQSRS